MTLLLLVGVSLLIGAAPDTEPPRSGVLTVLDGAISLQRREGAVEVAIPVQVNVLTPTATLKVTAALVGADNQTITQKEVLHTASAGPSTVGVTLTTDAKTEELRALQLRYRVRCLHPPAEASGGLPVDGLLSPAARRAQRRGLLSVVEKAVSLKKVEEGIDLTVPYHCHSSTPTVTIKLSSELIDADEKVVASEETSRRVSPGPGTIKVRLVTDLESHDLLPLRVRYRVRSLHPAGEVRGVLAVSELLAVPEVIVMAEERYLSGSRASIRVLALDHSSRHPLQGSRVRVSVSRREGDDLHLFEGNVDEAGTVEPVLEFPPGLEGKLMLRVDVETPLGAETIERNITVESSARTLLVTDKPTYQPGQTVYMRLLSLRRPTRQALAGAEAELQIQDPKGNVVFKEALALDSLGVGAASFVLADHVILGSYAVKATVGGEAVEKAVQVDRYVLPKFGIELSTQRPYYQPGQDLQGTVQATYFFGQPVSGAQVLLKLKKFDVETEVFQEIQGRLDEHGTFGFSVKLPSYFVGLPLEQGEAFVELEASVTDRAEHEEKAWHTCPVTEASLLMRVLPESGQPVGGVPNKLHAAVSYPDGSPVVGGTVNVTVGEERFSRETDELGLASFEVTVDREETTSVALLATDHKGNEVIKEVTLSPGDVGGGLLLRPSRHLARVGEPLTFQVLSSGAGRVAYLDLINEGQTVLTRSVPMRDGRGRLELVPDVSLTGTVWAHAYQVTRRGDLVRDTRVVYVDPASDLCVEVSTDQEQYRPGAPGLITLSVHDAAGSPTVAALGVAVVDEAVFARMEMRPGLQKVYFMLEEQIKKPRFEIHGFEIPLLVMNAPPPEAGRARLWEQRERAAEVMFASLEGPAAHTVEVNTFRESLESLRETFLERMARDWERIWRARQRWYRSRKHMPSELSELVDAGFLETSTVVDMWGMPYRWRIEPDVPWFELLSWGPDKIEGTADDLSFRGEELVRRRPTLLAEVVGAIPKAPQIAEELSIAEFKEVPAGGVEEPRVREYFPETMLFEPMVVTDRDGRAGLEVKWPDSITEWRLAATASTLDGELGSTVEGIKVFQPFFVDLDLPVALTQGDEVWIPVAVYNYLESEQAVRLELQEDQWFELLDGATKEKLMAPGEVDFVRFGLRAVSLGTQPVTVKAYGMGVSDAVSRMVDVVPDGREHVETFSDWLRGEARRTVSYPRGAVEGASRLLLRVLPGVMSQVVEGLRSIFRMPFGCFEQTSSITYPNVMVLDYMRRTATVTPELELTAEEYINLGYQRLLAYEVEGGGFEWFGNAPANLMLTAYGLMEFHDMSRVYEVDPKVLERTARWMLSKQHQDGHWQPDPEFLHAESWGKIQRSEVLPTAYVLWALQRAGFTGGETSTGLRYLEAHMEKVEDPYALALCANALVEEDPHSGPASRAVERLVASVIEEDDAAYWQSDVPTFAGARREAADLETTALAAMALLRHGGHPELTEKALTHLIRSRDPRGTWHTTQATVLVLQALLESLEAGGKRHAVGTLTVWIDQREAGELHLTQENAQVVQVLDLTPHVGPGEHEARLLLDGEGECAFDLVTSYYIPWALEAPSAPPILDIETSFDKTELQEKDLVVQRVRVTNRGSRPAKMVLVDLGLPPGFSPQAPDLEELVGVSIQKYELTGRQVIVYLEQLGAGEEVAFFYRLKARFPMRARSGVCRAYEYYNPRDVTIAPPIEMIVNESG